MEQFVILHQIPNQKNIVYSVQVASGDANLTFALLPNSDYIFIIYCQMKQVVLNDTGRSKECIYGDASFKPELIN